MRPVILLNDEALAASGEAEAIIAHELAHVARLDWAKLMLARVAHRDLLVQPARLGAGARSPPVARGSRRRRRARRQHRRHRLCPIAGRRRAPRMPRACCSARTAFRRARDSLRRRVSRVLDSSLARGAGGRSWVAGFAAGMLVMSAPLAALTFAPTPPKAPEPPTRAARRAPRGARCAAGAARAARADRAARAGRARWRRGAARRRAARPRPPPTPAASPPRRHGRRATPLDAAIAADRVARAVEHGAGRDRATRRAAWASRARRARRGRARHRDARQCRDAGCSA